MDDTKLLRKSINAQYRLAGKIFLDLLCCIYQYGKYRYTYHFFEIYLYKQVNRQYDKYHSAEHDNCPYWTPKNIKLIKSSEIKMIQYSKNP